MIELTVKNKMDNWYRQNAAEWRTGKCMSNVEVMRFEQGMRQGAYKVANLSVEEFKQLKEQIKKERRGRNE